METSGFTLGEFPYPLQLARTGAPVSHSPATSSPLNQSFESITIRLVIGIRQKMANARIWILFGQREMIKQSEREK